MRVAPAQELDREHRAGPETRRAAKTGGVRHRKHVLYGRIDGALRDPNFWHPFREQAYFELCLLWFGEREMRLRDKEQKATGEKDKLVPYDSALAWLRRNEQRVLLLGACQNLRPGPDSTGALEATTFKLRGMLSPRAQSLANRDRTQLLLRLIVAGQRGDAAPILGAERVRSTSPNLTGRRPSAAGRARSRTASSAAPRSDLRHRRAV